jgi:hypothetical protein
MDDVGPESSIEFGEASNKLDFVERIVASLLLRN